MLFSIVLLLISINLTASFMSPSFLMEYRARAIAVAMSSNPVDIRNLVIPEDKLLFSYARCSGPGKFELISRFKSMIVTYLTRLSHVNLRIYRFLRDLG
jgi:hypothetical protein